MTQTIFQGTFLVTQAAAAAIIDTKLPLGSIVNIASILGKTGDVVRCNYAASKAGVMAFTKSTSKELAKFGIRCNAVLPGFIETPMVSQIPAKARKFAVDSTPLGRVGTPEGNLPHPWLMPRQHCVITVVVYSEWIFLIVMSQPKGNSFLESFCLWDNSII